MDSAPTDAFVAERPRLLGLAYRMLGSLADAEDVAQEAWLRWSGADHEAIVNPAAWLTTTTTRLALDRARALGRRKETYVGPWLPEPVQLEHAAQTRSSYDPADVVDLAASLTLGFLVMLDRLSDAERAAFLLTDVFGERHAVVAEALGKSEEACRQLAARARKKVRDAHVDDVQPASHELLARLLMAVALDDPSVVFELVDPGITLTSDGGPARRAARHPVVGADRVFRLMANIAKKAGAVEDLVDSVQVTEVNGVPALVLGRGVERFVATGDVRDGRLVALRLVLNPDKLTHLGESADLV